MKTGFNLLLWTTHVTEEHYSILEELKDTGYDGVEVPIFEGSVSHYENLGRVLADLGLGCTAVTIIPDQERSPISEDAAARQAATDHIKWAIECTAACGGELLCGPFHQPLGQFSGEPPTEAERERGAEVHRRAAEIAEQHGVTLAIEYLNRFEAYFLNTMADSADYVKRVGHPSFGTMLDTFHANIEEKDPVGCILDHGDVIRHVHVSANDRGTPGRDHLDWDAIFRALHEIGYDDWITVEAFGRALPDLAAATRVWRDFFPSKEEAYTEGLKLIQEQWAAV